MPMRTRMLACMRPPAQVIRMLGNGRLEAQCIDGKKRLCHIRGKMRKKVWVAQVRGFFSQFVCFRPAA